MELKPDITERDLGLRPHKCRICNSEGLFQSYLACELMQNTRDEFEYFICPHCMCMQISEVPNNLEKYYSNGYYSFNQPDIDHNIYNHPPTNMKKVLDVGCGSGHWLVDMAEAGYGNLYGCDPFLKNEIHYGDRIHIKNCTIHEMDGDDSFDLIWMGDSYEHVTDPYEVLLSAKRLLKKKGFLVLCLPTYPNIAFDMFGPYWYQLDAPRHIFLHSKKSLKYLAEKCDLKIVDIQYDSNIGQIIRSFFYQNMIPFNEISDELIYEHFSEQEIIEIEHLCEEANQKHYGDHMTVYMQK